MVLECQIHGLQNITDMRCIEVFSVIVSSCGVSGVGGVSGRRREVNSAASPARRIGEKSLRAWYSGKTTIVIGSWQFGVGVGVRGRRNGNGDVVLLLCAKDSACNITELFILAD